MKKTNSSKGITLIALVITIIVLLILAGVTIVTLIGNDGILRQAQNAKEKTEESIKKENDFFESIKDKLKTDNTDENNDNNDDSDDNDDNNNEEDVSKSIELDKTYINFNDIEEKSQTITATLTNLSGTINWKTSNSDVATITPIDETSAEVSIINPGVAKITAECESCTAKCDVIYGKVSFVKGTYSTAGKLPTGVSCVRVHFNSVRRDWSNMWFSCDVHGV